MLSCYPSDITLPHLLKKVEFKINATAKFQRL
jgi:hypothetical protein